MFLKCIQHLSLGNTVNSPDKLECVDSVSTVHVQSHKLMDS